MYKPKDGLKFTHPDGRAFNPEGETVEPTQYYLRAIEVGDLERVPKKQNAKEENK